jgi:hypothetical protein
MRTNQEFEIGRILHLKSRNPKFRIELALARLGAKSNLIFRISGFEMQDSSDFKIVARS